MRVSTCIGSVLSTVDRVTHKGTVIKKGTYSRGPDIARVRDRRVNCRYIGTTRETGIAGWPCYTGTNVKIGYRRSIEQIQ